MFYQVHSQTTVLFPTFSSKQETKQEQVQEENHFMEVRCQWRRLWLISLTLNFSSKTDHQPVEPFEDEIHPRLRFSHRGLVGMANNGTKNSNDSQFFITLGPWSCFATVWSNLKLAVSPRCFNLSTFLQIELMSYMGSIRYLGVVLEILYSVRSYSCSLGTRLITWFRCIEDWEHGWGLYFFVKSSSIHTENV